MTELTPQQRAAREKVCLPLDGLHSLAEVRELVRELSPCVWRFKVGKESFTRFGPEVVAVVQSTARESFWI